MKASTIAKKLKLVYYSTLISIIYVAFGGWYILKTGVTIDPFSELGIMISSVLTIFIMGSTPISLWLFQRFTKKIIDIPNENEKLKKYQTGAIVRLVTLELASIVGIIFYYLMHSQSMLLAAAIAIVGLFLSKPSENKIIAELQLETTESENEIQ